MDRDLAKRTDNNYKQHKIIIITKTLIFHISMFSENAWWILTKLGRDVEGKVPYNRSTFRSGLMKYMATRGVLRFWLVDFQKCSPMKLQCKIIWNCAEMFYVRSFTNDPSLVPVGQINWAASGASRDIFYGPLTLWLTQPYRWTKVIH